MIDTIDSADKTAAKLRNEPIEKMENADPIEPIEPTDPMLPTESSDPELPIDSVELVDRMLSTELLGLRRLATKQL